MTATRKRIIAFLLIFAAGVGLLALVGLSRLQPAVIRGTVLGDDGPVFSAVVRRQGDADFTVTDARGQFALALDRQNADDHIAAWAPGYYVNVGQPDSSGNLSLTLHRHPTSDSADYAFISPVDDSSSSRCSRCHADKANTPGLSLPVDEWRADAHSGAATNARFLSLYNGTTVNGETGALTAYHFDAEAGVDVPVALSLGQESVGAGFRLDFPNETGPCANCHVPVQALTDGYHADPNQAQGAAQEGVTCDFCHKVSGVKLAADGKPSPQMPGVQSLEFLRPGPDEQVFLGPFDDTPGDDIYSPLQNQSQFCAACHTGTFWGVSIYDSFGEWLDSPYSDADTGQTCQSCHMPHLDQTQFVQLPPDVTQYVPVRDGQTIFSHRMPGASDTALLQKTAELMLETNRKGPDLWVSVTVTNTGAGHDIPTDNPLRNLILLIDARDANGPPPSLIDGPTIPEWGGVGDRDSGHYAGLPGILYAKILADAYTGETPTAAYWRQTRLVSDNRIAALASSESRYRFRVPADAGEITVEARLLLRRAFIALMEQKGWDTPDVLMEQETVTLKP